MGPHGERVACDRVNEGLNDRIDEGLHAPFRGGATSDREWNPLFSGLTALYLDQPFSGTQHLSLHSASERVCQCHRRGVGRQSGLNR